MTQGENLVFYGIVVNDVYAYYHQSAPKAAPTEFPDSKDQIEDLEQKYGHKFPDAQAMVVAVKTAWIEVGGDENDKKKYLTVETEIPVYDRRSAHVWIPLKKKKATLALVGMHVAFSATDRPKLIWATFEHASNTRNKAYKYKATAGSCPPTDVCEHQDGAWLFSNDDCSNEPRMHVDDMARIFADAKKTIGPSNICRNYAWGSDKVPDNTLSISINKSFIDQLPAHDVRRNYMMIGTNWYNGDDPQGGAELANSTMETFNGTSRCVKCHVAEKLSHIWSRVPAPKK